MPGLERSLQWFARREEQLRTIDENRLNTLRDQFDRAEFENALNQSIIQQNMLSQRNQAYNEAYQKATSNQSKNRPTSDSDLSKQLDHLEAMGFYARPTRFSFYIEALTPATNDRLIRNCISTSLPGRALMTQGFKIYGNPLEQVYEVNYATEMNMTFRVGEDMLERDLFESWMNTSISYNTADVSYPDDYMTTMRIYQLDRKDGYLYCIRLNNVFCKTIADMDFSSDSSDQVQTIQVTIAYSDFAVIGRTNTDPENLNNVEGFYDPTPSAFEDPPKSRATLNRSSANDQAREDQNLQQLRIRNAHYQNIRTIRVTPFTKFRY